MSVAVVCAAIGPAYIPFLERWSTAIQQLHTTPDEIVVVTDDVEEAEMWVHWQPHMRIIATDTVAKHHPQVCVNEAIAATSSDWVCKMDVDDVIYPHALDAVASTEADIYMFGIRHNGVNLPARPTNADFILNTMHNLVFSCSPFRRWVWERQPYLDMVCEDWMFWIHAAKNGARFHASRTIDYEYITHSDCITANNDLSYWSEVVRREQAKYRRHSMST